jgi:nitrogen fixation/metabolism regulation signal transduction histidine kinase
MCWNDSRDRRVALRSEVPARGRDAATRAKVFEAFFSTKRGGSGLGLPATRKIIEAHGDRMALQNEVGRGTQVTIKLPVPPLACRLRGGGG